MDTRLKRIEECLDSEASAEPEEHVTVSNVRGFLLAYASEIGRLEALAEVCAAQRNATMEVEKDMQPVVIPSLPRPSDIVIDGQLVSAKDFYDMLAKLSNRVEEEVKVRRNRLIQRERREQLRKCEREVSDEIAWVRKTLEDYMKNTKSLRRRDVIHGVREYAKELIDKLKEEACTL